MGTHGRTGLGRLLMGSVAEQTLRKATCPVLTVKAPLEDTSLARGRMYHTSTVGRTRMDNMMGRISRTIVIGLGVVLVIAASAMMVTWILLPVGIVTGAIGLMLILAGIPDDVPERPAKGALPRLPKAKTPRPMARARKREPEEAVSV
jgi:universal stress protein family protein